jgi:hypothetical protein
MPEKTLDELDPPAWGESAFQSSLVIRCHELRTKPIDELTVADLQTLIGQQIGLEYLLPRAVVFLEYNPLAEGDYYPGDLLQSVTSCGEFLQTRVELLSRVVKIADRAIAELGDDDYLSSRLREFLSTWSP